MEGIISKLEKVFLALALCVFALLFFIIYKSPCVIFDIKYVYILFLGLIVAIGLILLLCYYFSCEYLDKLHSKEKERIELQFNNEKEILNLKAELRTKEKIG